MSEQEVPKAVRVRQIELVDGKGQVYMVLGRQYDVPHITVFDNAGQVRCEIGLYDDGPGMVLLDERGKTRAILALGEDGEPSMSLFDGISRLPRKTITIP